MAAGWSYIENESTRRATAEIIQQNRRLRRSIEDIEILCCAKLDECLTDFDAIGTTGSELDNDEGLRTFRVAVYPFLRELRDATPSGIRDVWKKWKAKAEVCRLKKKCGTAPTDAETDEARKCGQIAIDATKGFFLELFRILHPLRMSLRNLFTHSGDVRTREWLMPLSTIGGKHTDEKRNKACKKLESSLRSFMEQFYRLCSADQPDPSVLPEVGRQMDMLVELLERRRQIVSGQGCHRSRKTKTRTGGSYWEVERTDKMIAKVREWHEAFLNDPGTRTTHVLPTFDFPDFGEIDWWRERRYDFLNNTSSATGTHTRRAAEQPAPRSVGVRDTLAEKVESLQANIAAIDATTRDTNERVQYLESVKRKANRERSITCQEAALSRGPNPDMAEAIRRVHDRVTSKRENATTASKWVCEHWKRTGSERNPIWEPLMSARGEAMKPGTLYKAYITQYPVKETKAGIR